MPLDFPDPRTSTCFVSAEDRPLPSLSDHNLFAQRKVFAITHGSNEDFYGIQQGVQVDAEPPRFNTCAILHRGYFGDVLRSASFHFTTRGSEIIDTMRKRWQESTWLSDLREHIGLFAVTPVTSFGLLSPGRIAPIWSGTRRRCALKNA